MITSWKEIAKRVAKNLDIPIEEVEADIIKYKKELHNALREGRSFEYDFFYIGKLVHIPFRITRYWWNIKDMPDKRNYPYVKMIVDTRKKLSAKKARSKLRWDKNKEHREKHNPKFKNKDKEV